MQLAIVIAILLAQCALLAVALWAVRTGRTGLAAKKPERPRTPGILENPEAVSRLLGEADASLFSHAGELRKFQAALLNQRSGETSNTNVEESITDLHQANVQVDSSLDALAQQIKQALGDSGQAMCPDLQAYQAKTQTCDKQLVQMRGDPLLAGIADRLLDVIRDLRQENTCLRHEVSAAKDQVIESMSRAHAAEQVARMDVLTKLPNRRAFEESLTELHAALNRHGQVFCVVLFDLDHFKSVNDKYGHSAGDAVLALVGQLFKETQRPTDHTCRLGGEEFALLLPRCDLNTAKSVANRYREKVAGSKLRYEGQVIGVTMSGGIAEAQVGEEASRVLQRADAALYRGKQEGRNRICCEVEETKQKQDAQEAAVLSAC
jgi:diguanylate cyclase